MSAVEASRGCNWILTVVEMMRAEWGCTLHQALFSESISAALSLWPAMLARHGAEVHVDHGDTARQEARERMRAYLAEHYEISTATMPRPNFMGLELPPLG